LNIWQAFVLVLHVSSNYSSLLNCTVKKHYIEHRICFTENRREYSGSTERENCWKIARTSVVRKKPPRYIIWFHYEMIHKIQSRQCLWQQRITRISDFLLVCSFSISVLYFVFTKEQVAKIPVALALKDPHWLVWQGSTGFQNRVSDLDIITKRFAGTCVFYVYN